MTADTIQPPSVLLVEETFTPGPGDHSLFVFIRYQRTAAAMLQTPHYEDGGRITSFAPDPMPSRKTQFRAVCPVLIPAINEVISGSRRRFRFVKAMGSVLDIMQAAWDRRR